MAKKPKKCGICGSNCLEEMWHDDSHIVSRCAEWDCNWESPPYLTQKIPVTNRKKITSGGPWRFELLDKRGHVRMFSQGFTNRTEAVADAKLHLSEDRPHVVVYPPIVELIGELFTENG